MSNQTKRLMLDSQVLWEEMGDTIDHQWFLAFYDWFIAKGLLLIDPTRLRDRHYVVFREKFTDVGADYWESVVERFRAKKRNAKMRESDAWLEAEFQKWSARMNGLKAVDTSMTLGLVVLVINTYSLVRLSFGSSQKPKWFSRQRELLRAHARGLKIGIAGTHSLIRDFLEEAEALLCGKGGDEEEVQARYEEVLTCPDFRAIAKGIQIPCLLEKTSEAQSQIRELSLELTEPNLP